MWVAGRFKSYFLRGLAALLPTLLTIWIFVQFYTFVQENISVHINRGLVRVIVFSYERYISVTDEQVNSYLKEQEPALFEPGHEQDLAGRKTDPELLRRVKVRKLDKFWVKGAGRMAGFVVTLFAVFVVGVLLASVVGRTIWRSVEGFLMKTPLLKKVYPYIKQITDFLFTQKKLSFSRVVAVEYPRKGIWSIGLVTGSGLEKITGDSEKEFLTIFVPTSPTPFTGYVIMTPKQETIDLNMTIEEALRFTISGGVITPDENGEFNFPTDAGRLQQGQAE